MYRAKFVPTIFAARQFINHGHVNVNGRRVNIQSYRLKVGDVVEVREKSKQLAIVLEAVQLAERDVPDYIDVDHNKMVATYNRVPGLSDVLTPSRWNRTSWSNSTRANSVCPGWVRYQAEIQNPRCVCSAGFSYALSWNFGDGAGRAKRIIDLSVGM